MNLAIVGWALLCFAGAMVLGWPLLEVYLRERQAALDRMMQFSQWFISEFERPLVRPNATEGPLKSRVRCLPDRDRLEILLAPHAGRTYPNLSDHRKNVEYDVARIARDFDKAVKIDNLYCRGCWVVISFRFDASTNRTNGGVA